MTARNEQNPLPITPGHVTSQGVHLGELTENLANARRDTEFTPLLTGAEILPQGFLNSRIVPGVLYGVKSRRLNGGAEELVPGSAALVYENIGTEYYNPHYSVKARAQNITRASVRRRQERNVPFTFSGYVFESGGARHLFIGGDNDDLERLGAEYSEALAEAYDLGSVVVGNSVAVGEIKVKLGRVSLPALMREIGQNIATFPGTESSKIVALDEAKISLSRGKSPDYRSHSRSLGRQD